MKTLLIIIAALSATAAYAGDINESPIRGKGAFSVVHNEPAANPKIGNTREQINAVLASQGQPTIGTSRVIQNDSSGDNSSAAPKPATRIVTTHTWSKSSDPIDINIYRHR